MTPPQKDAAPTPPEIDPAETAILRYFNGFDMTVTDLAALVDRVRSSAPQSAIAALEAERDRLAAELREARKWILELCDAADFMSDDLAAFLHPKEKT